MEIQIGQRWIGDGHPVFVIAELSANHLQDYDLAVKTIEAAADAKVDAIKVQTYTPDTLTLNCENEYFQIKQGTIWDGTTLYRLYEQAYMPWEWQPGLKKIANNLGMTFFSSPFDSTAVDFLEKMDVPAYKIASFEISDLALAEYTATKEKPVLVSAGIADPSDIERFIRTCEDAGNKEVVVLKCTSAYPAAPGEMNLNTIPDMEKRFGCIVGLSDHTMGICACIAAVALGAKVIEKHIILDRSLKGPDSVFSLEPAEFKSLVAHVREAEKMLGTVNYNSTPSQRTGKAFGRSLFVVKDVKKGDKISRDNIRSIRPGFGMACRHLDEVLGKRFTKNAEKGTPLSDDLVNKS